MGIERGTEAVGRGAGRKAAAALKGSEEGAFGSHRLAKRGVVQRFDERPDAGIVRAAFDRQHALSGGGEHLFEPEDVARAVL